MKRSGAWPSTLESLSNIPVSSPRSYDPVFRREAGTLPSHEKCYESSEAVRDPTVASSQIPDSDSPFHIDSPNFGVYDFIGFLFIDQITLTK
jgi:hypothetical protein